MNRSSRRLTRDSTRDSSVRARAFPAGISDVPISDGRTWRHRFVATCCRERSPPWAPKRGSDQVQLRVEIKIQADSQADRSSCLRDTQIIDQVVPIIRETILSTPVYFHPWYTLRQQGYCLRRARARARDLALDSIPVPGTDPDPGPGR